MKFTHHQLGNLEADTTIELSLKGNAANVRLMDDHNFRQYKRGRRHRYQGGLIKKSPIHFKTSKRANWHLTVDLAGLAGRVSSSVKILPKPLSLMKTTSSEVSPEQIRQFVQIKPENDDYDVFISHASEDKSGLVRPLAEALRTLGLRVWYDEFELGIGDSLRRKIDQGISRSRFGIVVLSEHFIQKGWTEYELDGIVARTVKGKQRLLPIWHDLSSDQVMEYSPNLADKVALSTAHHTVLEIANKIFTAVSNQGE